MGSWSTQKMEIILFSIFIHKIKFINFCKRIFSKKLCIFFQNRVKAFLWSPSDSLHNYFVRKTIAVTGLWLSTYLDIYLGRWWQKYTVERNNLIIGLKSEQPVTAGADATEYVRLLFTCIGPRNPTYTVASAPTMSGVYRKTASCTTDFWTRRNYTVTQQKTQKKC